MADSFRSFRNVSAAMQHREHVCGSGSSCFGLTWLRFFKKLGSGSIVQNIKSIPVKHIYLCSNSKDENFKSVRIFQIC